MHGIEQDDEKTPEGSRQISYCAVSSFCVALVFFIGYYSPHGSSFSLRFYFGASLISALLAGFFFFIIRFSVLQIPKFRHYLSDKNALEKTEFEDSNYIDPNAIEEKTRHPQPLSDDLYYDSMKINTQASWPPEN